jgi:hypothetical protein
MPILKNPRHEAFAQARAKGAVLEDAFEDAGFAPDRGHASRLAARDEVAERIAELKAEQAEIDGASTRSVIAALLRLAEGGQKLESPAALKEVRLALLDAQRLVHELAVHRQIDRNQWRLDGQAWP